MKKLWQTIKEIDDPDNPEWKTAYEELLIKCGWVKQNERWYTYEIRE